MKPVSTKSEERFDDKITIPEEIATESKKDLAVMQKIPPHKKNQDMKK